MGFCRFADINSALLSKLAWKIAREDDLLWVSTLRVKYLKGQSFFLHNVKTDASFVWKSIISARKWITLGACVQLSNGFNTNVWSDPWIPNLEGGVPKPFHGEEGSIRIMADLRNIDGEGWNEDLLKRTFNEEVVKLILNIAWPSFPV